MHTARRIIAWLPFMAAIMATVYLLIVPIWGGVATTAKVDASGQPATTTWQTPPQRVVDVGGGITLTYLLAMPTVAAVCSWGAMRSKRWQVVAAGLLLTGGVVMGAMSIGFLLLAECGPGSAECDTASTGSGRIK